MSRELAQLLQERARVGVMRWPMGLILSLVAHGAVVAMFFMPSSSSSASEETKVTWVSLPAMTGGTSGGSEAEVQGDSGERQRRVEDVAPDVPKPSSVSPNAWGEKATAPAKGTNKDTSSLGKAPDAAKSKTTTANPVKGAVGSGNGAALGQGSGIPGLRTSGGVQGGTGLIGETDASDFPIYYLQQIQNKITSNWIRISSSQGRVQIYFRIKRDGTLDSARVEVPSGNAGLDQSALLAVKRSDPLPRLPDGFEGKSLGVRFWFSYLGN